MTMKTVRFSTDDLETIVPTYSNVDYDRSFQKQSSSSMARLREQPQLCNNNKAKSVKAQQEEQARRSKPTSSPVGPSARPYITPLDLSGVPNACRRTPAMGHQIVVVREVSSLIHSYS